MYAVCGGPFAGVYSTWAEAEKATKGVKGARCKKCPDQAAAEAYVRNGSGGAVSSSSCSSRAKASPPVAVLPAAAPPPVTVVVPAAPVALPANGRIYLQVPFAEKDEAKALGAKWDPDRKKWYASSTGDFARLTKWPVVREDEPPPKRPPQLDKVPTLFLSAEERKIRAVADSGEHLLLYTDGSCLGNKNVALRSQPAGWGVVVVVSSTPTSKGLLEAELFGPVILDSASDKFLGAEVASNNTGELSGICEALLWLRDWEHSCRPAVICYDSVYAAKTTSGEFNANKNLRLVQSAKTLLREVKAQRKVTMKHVKGHSGNPWNDSVDRLAKRGAGGEHCQEGRWGPRAARAAKRSADGEPCSERSAKLETTHAVVNAGMLAAVATGDHDHYIAATMVEADASEEPASKRVCLPLAGA